MDPLQPLRTLRRYTLHRLGVRGFPGVRLTPRRLANLFLVNWDLDRGTTRLRGYPLDLEIELTNTCNLRCPACFTGVGEFGRPRSQMTLAAYRQHLEELGPYLFGIEFHNWGESLLHPQIWDAVRIARSHGVSTAAVTHFSLNLDEAAATALVSSGLNVLGVSLDGATQKTYEKYRVRGRLDRVLENIRLVQAAKQRLRSDTPRLMWSYHIFDHNTHEIETARAMAVELGMEFAPTKGWVEGPQWDPELLFEPSPGRPQRCEFLWRRATINNDSGVSPCHGTFFRDDDFAVVGESSAGRPGAQSFRGAWNNDNFRRARSYYNGPSPPAKHDLLCRECPATIRWNAYQLHLRQGGHPDAFTDSFTLNEGFNFFFQRRNSELRLPRRRLASA